MQELVSLAPRDLAPEDVAHPYLQDLADITGQPVQLVVLDGGESVTVDRADGVEPSRAPTRVPAPASCGGLVLLAHAPKRLVDTVLAGGMIERRWDAAPGVLERVRAAIEVARKKGHLELRSTSTGTVSVAAPVLIGADHAVAAVAISGAPGLLPLPRARRPHDRAQHRPRHGRPGHGPDPPPVAAPPPRVLAPRASLATRSPSAPDPGRFEASTRPGSGAPAVRPRGARQPRLTDRVLRVSTMVDTCPRRTP